MNMCWLESSGSNKLCKPSKLDVYNILSLIEWEQQDNHQTKDNVYPSHDVVVFNRLLQFEVCMLTKHAITL